VAVHSALLAFSLNSCAAHLNQLLCAIPEGS
jgi:hypothetical protein